MRLRLFITCILLVLPVGYAQDTMGQSGTRTYAIKRTNIAQSSQLLAFGFTANVIVLSFPMTNTDDVCVSLNKYEAVCPADNTAGDMRAEPGSTLVLDRSGYGFLSVIAQSGTQTINVRAIQ